MKTFNKLSSLIILAGGLFLLQAACKLSVQRGSGNIQMEERPVSGFDAVNFSGSGELSITQGDTETLTVEADDNLLPFIKTEVRNGVLFISMEEGSGGAFVRPSQPIHFNLAIKDLSALTLSGSGRTTSPEIKADRLSLDVSGSGSLKIDQLETADLSLLLSGSGQVDLGGKATSQQAGLSGSGSYLAGDLESQTARVTSDGSGSGTIWVSDKLEVRLSGSGSVSYYGSPTVSSEVTGSGSLKSLGSK